jgi:hypothetical protein
MNITSCLTLVDIQPSYKKYNTSNKYKTSTFQAFPHHLSPFFKSSGDNPATHTYTEHTLEQGKRKAHTHALVHLFLTQ